MFRYCIDLKVRYPLSLHEILITFYTSDNFTPDADSFLTFASSIMTLDLCDKVAIDTNNQSKLWNELKYRLTASRFYEMAHCGVSSGSLVNQVIGCTKIMDTKSMRRGRNLEKKVIKVLEEKNKLSLGSCSLLLNPEFPVIEAFPNAVAHFIMEIPNDIKN